MEKGPKQVKQQAPAVPGNQRDPVESDTESLAHERATTQTQQLPEHRDYTGENLQVSDSLELAAAPPTTGTLSDQLHEREAASPRHSDDACSDLLHDPDLKGGSCLRPHGSDREHHPAPRQKSSPSQEPIRKGVYRYISCTSPAVAVNPHLGGSDQPFRLHPATPPHHHKHDLQPASSEADLTNTLLSVHKDKRDNICDNEHMKRSSESTESSREIHALHLTEDVAHHGEDLGHPQGGPTQSPSPQESPKAPRDELNRSRGRHTEDIVERNKRTLGQRTSTPGSYVRVHALRQGEKLHAVRKVCDPEAGAAESPDTHQLRVTQISKGQKSQRKETPHPSPQKQSSSGLPQPEPLRKTLDDEAQPALSQAHPQRHPADSPHLCWQEPPAELQHESQENSPDQYQSRAALLGEGRDLKWSPNQVCQDLTRTPPTSWSQGSSPHAVLPPIGNSGTATVFELNSGQSVNTPNPVHPSQMHKQREAKRITFQAYSLKDYKELRMQEVKLGSLGPDYMAIHEKAEKMKRQKLYSNVIREKNKKISTIPPLLAKDLDAKDKKVSRIKALDYARTIPKPLAPPQPKLNRKQQCRGVRDHTPDNAGMSSLATLERLRRRHEEEKQAVARLKIQNGL